MSVSLVFASCVTLPASAACQHVPQPSHYPLPPNMHKEADQKATGILDKHDIKAAEAEQVECLHLQT